MDWIRGVMGKGLLPKSDKRGMACCNIFLNEKGNAWFGVFNFTVQTAE